MWFVGTGGEEENTEDILLRWPVKSVESQSLTQWTQG